MIFTYSRNILVLTKKKKTCKTNQKLEKYSKKLEKNKKNIFYSKY